MWRSYSVVVLYFKKENFSVYMRINYSLVGETYDVS